MAPLTAATSRTALRCDVGKKTLTAKKVPSCCLHLYTAPCPPEAIKSAKRLLCASVRGECADQLDQLIIFFVSRKNGHEALRVKSADTKLLPSPSTNKTTTTACKCAQKLSTAKAPRQASQSVNLRCAACAHRRLTVCSDPDVCCHDLCIRLNYLCTNELSLALSASGLGASDVDAQAKRAKGTRPKPSQARPGASRPQARPGLRSPQAAICIITHSC